MRIGDDKILDILNEKAADIIIEGCKVHFTKLIQFNLNQWYTVFKYKRGKGCCEESDAIYIDHAIMDTDVEVLARGATTFKFKNNYLTISNIGKETLNNI